jgi:hemerythrin-like domain-containing protein
MEVPMKSTDELKNEHEGILLMLRIIETVSGKMESGVQIPSADLDGIMEFLSVFVDKCHHGKEEDFLFPALEAVGILREGGPIGLLLDEHRKGREIVAKLKEAVNLYKSGNQNAPTDFTRLAADYISLMTQHIDKENNVLFPMADARLDPAEDIRLFESFEKLEKERIGPGKHEEFHGLLNHLEKEYIS